MARIAKSKRRRQVAPKPAPSSRPSGRTVLLAFGVAIAAALALVVLAVVLRTDDDSAPPTPTATPVVDFEGIPQDGIVLGSPDAEVTLIEYADLQCPACRAYTEVVFPEVLQSYVRPGRVKAEFRGIGFIGPDSATALRYVLAAGLQDRLWQLQEALYRNQGGENAGWVTEALLRELAASIPGLDVDRVLADANSDEVTAMIGEAAAQADAAEVRGTPTLAIQIGDDEPYTLQSGISAAGVAAALDDALGA
jgi:protein-disulfide isomerase